MSSFRIGQPTWAVNHPWNLPRKIQVFGGKWSYGKNVGEMFFWVWVTGCGIQSSLILSTLKPGKSFLLKHGNSLLGIHCNRKNLKYNIQKDSPPEAFFACLNHGLTPTLHIEGMISQKEEETPSTNSRWNVIFLSRFAGLVPGRAISNQDRFILAPKKNPNYRTG